MDQDIKPAMLEVGDVVHKYGSVTALDHVSLEARKGEFLTILGSSGSGKTTMLRVISGLERPAAVNFLRIDGEDVVGLPPSRRNCTTVFQNYALFPHMSVQENVAYGLRVRGLDRETADKEARDALAMVRLEAKATRGIAQLSGGERQRVALARAIVTKPAVLLLDEPLGALDERLRLDMQGELVEIQRALGMTFVYITHSQEEALTMSDRIVLMQHGRIEQSGRPVELFDRPASRFAAEFMGYENLFEGRVRAVEGEMVVIELAGGVVARGLASGPRLGAGDLAVLAVRAERFALAEDGSGFEPSMNVLPCKLEKQIYHGKYVDQTVGAPVGDIKLRKWDRAPAEQKVNAIAWRAKDGVVLRMG